MNKLSKKYGTFLQLFTLILSLICLFDFTNTFATSIVNTMTLIFIMFTIFLSLNNNNLKKVKWYHIIMPICSILLVALYCIIQESMDFGIILSLISLIVIPINSLIIDNVRVSDRFLGLITIVVGIFSIFKIGNIESISSISLVLLPLSLILILREKNHILNILYLISSLSFLSFHISEEYILVLFTVLGLLLSFMKCDNKRNYSNYLFIIVYLFGISLIVFHYIDLSIYFSLLLSLIAIKGYKNKKLNLLFTSYDLSIGGIETSLVNLLNAIDKNKYSITLLLEKKKGILLNKIDKEVEVECYKVYEISPRIISKVINLIKRFIFSIFNFNTYDFSCCYATYSYSGNKIAKITSKNSSIWVHSNYRQAYSNINDTLEFFNSRKMNDFRRIIFVSKESKKDYLELYPKDKGKTLVFNNLIDIKSILNKKDENVSVEKPKNKKLLVFVGRLDEKSKRITRIIDIAKNINDIAIWIIGDGKDKEMYEKLINDNKLEKKVSMLGSIKEPYNYMNLADYIILTSEYEGFPVIYLEALALDKEIITTIPVSDDSLDFSKIAHIISKDNYVEDIKEILNNNKNKNRNRKVDINKVQSKRLMELDKLFKGVI